MGSSVSREEDAKKLLQQGATTFPLGSQVEKLFHEDFDDDAQAILTPLTPSTPALIGDDSKKKRWSLNSASKEQKWAPVQPTMLKRDSLQVPASNVPGSERSSINSASSLALSSEDLKEATAKDVPNSPEHNAQARAALDLSQSSTSEKDLVAKEAPPKISTTIHKEGVDAGKGATNSPAVIQKAPRAPELLSPQSAVARIAKRMKAGTSSTRIRSQEDKARHDSRLMSESATSVQISKPADVLPVAKLPVAKLPAKAQKPVRRHELVSPQVAVSRIARRMSMNAMASRCTNDGDDAAKHDSKVLLKIVTTEEGSQPDIALTGSEQSTATQPVSPLSIEDSTSAVLEKLQSPNRSQSQLESPDSMPQAAAFQRSEESSKVLIDNALITEVGATSKYPTTARWQQRVSRRISDQGVSEAEKKRLSQLSDRARKSWLEDASTVSSDKEV